MTTSLPANLALNLKDCLNERYQHLRGEALANAPLEALSGISSEEADALRSITGADTISELANNATVLMAQAAAQAANTSLSPSQEAFYTTLAANVQSSLGAAIGGTFTPVSLPTGFPVCTQSGSFNYYNQDTLVALDSLLAPANNTILLSCQDQTFSNLYYKIVQQGYWNLSDADLAIINSPSVGQAQQLVWTATTQDNYPSQSSAGWVAFIQYTLNTYAAGQPQYSTNSLIVAANNMSLFYPNVSRALTTYVNTQGPASAIALAQAGASTELLATQANVSQPSNTNGGLQTGTNAYYVGYTVPVWATLTSDLNNTSNTVSVSMSASDFSGTSTNLTIGTATSSTDIGFFSVTFKSSASTYNFSSYTNDNSVVTLTVNYTGVTYFGSSPRTLASNNTTGWYDNTVLEQINQTWNNTKSTTGFAISASTAYQPPITFGIGKSFGRLKTWVISNPPSISFTVTNANVAAMQTAFQQYTSVAKISLFGVSTGFSSSGYTVSSYEQNGSSVTVTLSATAVPLLPSTEQVAFVLGGVASYPPDNT
jgi:hypothetical protein